MIYSTITVTAQQPLYPKPNGVDNIPFGKKLQPPPSLNLPNGNYQIPSDRKLSGGTYTTPDQFYKRFDLSIPDGMKTGNPLTQPLSGNGNALQSMDALKNTTANFHLTKDINTHRQPFSSYPNNTRTYPNMDNFYLSFAVLNNVSYFAADDGIHGTALWRSDGTAEGTFMVKDIIPGAAVQT